MENSFDLSRFTKAHRYSYQTALSEIKNGRKTSHWMWYIFPQMRGLGRSDTSRYYAIQSLDEAKAFLKDPYLGKNLLEISNTLLALDTNNATEVFGKPDDWKLKSCMTLLFIISEDGSVFHKVLDKFFYGKPDKRTLKMLNI